MNSTASEQVRQLFAGVSYPGWALLALIAGALATLALASKIDRKPLLVVAIGVVAAIAAFAFGMMTNGIGRLAVCATSVALVLSYASLFTVELFEPKQKPEAAALLAIGAIGAIVLATAANLLELALGVETLSISGAVLVAIGAGQRPLEAAFKYFVLTAVTFATLLFGMSIIFVGTGSLDITTLHVIAQGSQPAHLFVVGGLALIGVGLAFKLALVPVHFGALDAYTAGAPALVGFVQVASKLGAVIALARLAREAGASMHTVLLVVGLTTIVWGVLASFAQTDFRRLLAYSAVAHAGFLALAAGVNDTGIGLRTVGFYIVGYGAAALLCFACLAGRGTGPLPLNALDREKLGPLRALGLMIGLLSLAGVPPLPGFWVKIAVLRISWDSYGPTATIIAALGGVFGVIYYLRPLPQLFAEIRRGTPAANGTRFAIVASAAIVLALGFVPALAWNLALSN